MTGPLVIALYEDHMNQLHAAAERRRSWSKPRGKQRVPARPGLLRPRRALAA